MSKRHTIPESRSLRATAYAILALAVNLLTALGYADPDHTPSANALDTIKKQAVFLELEKVFAGYRASFDTVYAFKIPPDVNVTETSTNLLIYDYVRLLDILKDGPLTVQNQRTKRKKRRSRTQAPANQFPVSLVDTKSVNWKLTASGVLVKKRASPSVATEEPLTLSPQAIDFLLGDKKLPSILAFYDTPTAQGPEKAPTPAILYVMVPSPKVPSAQDKTDAEATSSQAQAGQATNTQLSLSFNFQQPRESRDKTPADLIPVPSDSSTPDKAPAQSHAVGGFISFSSDIPDSSDTPIQTPTTSPTPDVSHTPDPKASPTSSPRGTETPAPTETPASTPGNPVPTVIPATPVVPPPNTPNPPHKPPYPPQDPSAVCGASTHNLLGITAGCSKDTQACCRTDEQSFSCIEQGTAQDSWGNSYPNCVEYRDGSSCTPQDISACARKDDKLVCCPSLQDPTRGTCVTPDRCCQSTLPLSVNKSCIDPYGKQLGLFCCNTRPDVPIQQPGNEIDAFRCVVQGVGAPPATLPDGSKLDNGNAAPYCLPDCNKEKQNTLHPDGTKACCNTSCAEKFEWVPLNKIGGLPSPPKCSNGNIAPTCALETCSKDQQNKKNSAGDYCCATTCDPYQLKWVSKNQGFFCPPGSLDNPSGNGNKINACIKPCEDGPDSLSGTSPSMGDSGCDPKTGSCNTCTEEKDKCPDCNKPNMEPDPYTGRCRCIQDNSQQCLASGRLWNAAECSCDDVPFYSEFRGLGAFSFSAYQSGRFSPELFPDTNSPKLGAPGQESDPPDSADGKGKHGIILKSCGVAQRPDHTIGVRCEPLTMVDCADGRAKGMKGTCDSPCADPSRSGDEPSRDLCACLSEKCCQSPFVWDPLSQACTCQELKTVKLGPPQCPADSPTKLRLDTSECWCKTADSREWEMPSCPRGEFDSKSCSCVDVMGLNRLVNHPNARKDFNPRSCQYECHGDDQRASDLCTSSGGSFNPGTCDCNLTKLPTLQMQAFAASGGKTVVNRFIIGASALLRVVASEALRARIGSEKIEFSMQVNNKECPEKFKFALASSSLDRPVVLMSLIRSISPRFNKSVTFRLIARWRQHQLGSISVPATLAASPFGRAPTPRKDPLTASEFEVMCRSASNFRE